MRIKVLSLIAAVAVLFTMLPVSTTFADDDSRSARRPFTANLVNLVASGGTITVAPLGNSGKLLFRTNGEVTTATIDCAGNRSCLQSGVLQGSTAESVHDSQIVATPSGLGTFTLKGRLRGSFLIAGQYEGTAQASISGTATCVEYEGDPCAWLSFNVQDKGTWQIKSLKARGDIKVQAHDEFGVGLVGSGTLSGVIDVEKPKPQVRRTVKDLNNSLKELKKQNGDWRDRGDWNDDDDDDDDD